MTGTEAAWKQEARKSETAKPGRPSVSNVLDVMKETPDGPIPVTIYRPINEIGDELRSAAQGEPRVAMGIPFALAGGGRSIRWLEKPDSLFAWMHEVVAVRWSSRGSCRDAETKGLRAPPTKGEFWHHVRESSPEKYKIVHTYPHHPPMKGTYYLPVELPAPTGGALAEFMDALNPDSDHDRLLMLAALLTPGWGGEPGTRPLFCFTSEYGPGSGKTSTARAMANVWGGFVELDHEKPWPDLTKQIMSSDEHRDARVMLFDNVRGKFGKTLTSAVTAKQITGHRMYVGTVSRPNDATMYVTLNTPQFTHEFVKRAVIIKIGAPDKGKAFVDWSERFIAEHRLQLIADLLHILRGEPRFDIPATSRDRWQSWQDGVLRKIPCGERLPDLINERQPAADDDEDEALRLMDALQGLEDAVGSGSVTAHQDGWLAMGRDIHAAIVRAKCWQDDPSKSAERNRESAMKWARERLSGYASITATGQRREFLDTDQSTKRGRVFYVRLMKGEKPKQEDDIAPF